MLNYGRGGGETKAWFHWVPPSPSTVGQGQPRSCLLPFILLLGKLSSCFCDLQLSLKVNQVMQFYSHLYLKVSHVSATITYESQQGHVLVTSFI